MERTILALTLPDTNTDVAGKACEYSLKQKKKLNKYIHTYYHTTPTVLWRWQTVTASDRSGVNIIMTATAVHRCKLSWQRDRVDNNKHRVLSITTWRRLKPEKRVSPHAVCIRLWGGGEPTGWTRSNHERLAVTPRYRGAVRLERDFVEVLHPALPRVLAVIVGLVLFSSNRFVGRRDPAANSVWPTGATVYACEQGVLWNDRSIAILTPA